MSNQLNLAHVTRKNKKKLKQTNASAQGNSSTDQFGDKVRWTIGTIRQHDIRTIRWQFYQFGDKTIRQQTTVTWWLCGCLPLEIWPLREIKVARTGIVFGRCVHSVVGCIVPYSVHRVGPPKNDATHGRPRYVCRCQWPWTFPPGRSVRQNVELGLPRTAPARHLLVWTLAALGLLRNCRWKRRAVWGRLRFVHVGMVSCSRTRSTPVGVGAKQTAPVWDSHSVTHTAREVICCYGK